MNQTMRVSAGLMGVVAVAAWGVHSCRRPAPDALLGDLTGLVRPGEVVQLLRRVAPTPVPGSPGATAPVPELQLLVVRTRDGKSELRIGEQRSQGRVQVHASRPGDEFRNLTVEDVNADGRPEVVTQWQGGQLEVVEVLGRDTEGSWSPLLQNAGQIVEERRLPDRTTAFFITSRTYEEEAGHPPVYETLIYRWDGKGFAQDPPK